jgi:GT2 family glycosyltransferase
MGGPDASVVIVTRDRPLFAADAVRSVLAGDVQPREVIVVDQSRDHDVILNLLQEEHPTVRLVRSTGRGLSRGRNLGASKARGELVAFLDDDELADAGWLAAFVEELRHDRAAVVTGRVLPGAPEAANALVSATILHSEPARYRGRLSHDPLAGGNMAARRATLTEIGGFDSRLGAGSPWPGAEDNDLGLRLLDAGYTIAYVPTAVVVHRAWRPARSYPRIRWAYGLGKGGFYAKHAWGHGLYGLRRAARDIGKRLLRAPAAALRGPRYAVGELAYAAAVIVGFVRWKAHRN